VLVQGPYGTLLPLVCQIANLPHQSRPVLAYWFQQSLYTLRPTWLGESVAQAFSDLSRSAGDAGWMALVLNRILPGFVSTRGRRFGFQGDILWLYREGMLDVLALSSTVYENYFIRKGIAPLLVPRGYDPSYGRKLGFERDIAVVWLGKTRTRRRKRVVYSLREELARRGLAMHIYDGEERPFIFGEERTQILNRAWFVLNVFTQPSDELSIRYYVAAANGAVVLTEPGENRYPFVPGRHLVQCRVQDMPDAVVYYLTHKEKWRAISEAMSQLVEEKLTLEESLASILARAEEVLKDKDRRSSKRVEGANLIG